VFTILSANKIQKILFSPPNNNSSNTRNIPPADLAVSEEQEKRHSHAHFYLLADRHGF
jgi:hypothetical protein